MSDLIEGYLGKTVEGKKSRTPAKLDYLQSATGLFLGLFMWGHMLFVSTILISKDFMYSVTKFFEGSFIFNEGQPIIVSGIALVVFIIFIAHAAMGMRKLPANFKQYQVMKAHANNMGHEDTKLWFIQAFTGFAMFFLGSVHLYIIMTQADAIGPYASADRVWSNWMWPLYILLLLAVEFHGTIGLYRLAVKWGWFDGKDPKASRKKLKAYKKILTVFFLVLGFATLAAYMKIGMDHAAAGKVGERYTPTAQIMEYKINNGRVA
ncbi:Fumarate reductase respiratory complex [Arcobacter nitrofigilis DSM 7299]|uniref:Fumarate reductase cytochrome b subunit n=1 Tax=Arcobacter nitrofigilis (strain ATCC 33309 / DSM 7299 / CCUG 15893 / LMG 7604 / NCTC 12251 / CI) TaxID=572480 RepID=D5V6P4_ARCNC|nr:fumarate reductase cytochrome b subunit [Arcobacter nitrofigilis]ADG94314.1 Fumarate reductase respiratory complex [Arcobacter nitrofigilis DSM 7299]